MRKTDIGNKEKVLCKANEQNNASGETNRPKRRQEFLRKHAKIFAINLVKIACLFVFFYLIQNYLH